MPVRKNSKRSKPLDILKGIAILFVTITHCSWQPEERLVLGFPFWIDMAVPIFMLIMSYLYAKSYTNLGIVRLIDIYNTRIKVKEVLRFTVPFAIIYIAEIAGIAAMHALGSSRSLPKLSLIPLDFIKGGIGPGSYYYPILLQFVLCFPLIFMLVRKLNHQSLVIGALINLIYEILKSLLNMSEGLYRLVFLRYFFIVTLGCYYALHHNLSNEKSLVFGRIFSFIGFAFIVSSNYMGLNPGIFNLWTTTCMLASIFALPVFLFAAKLPYNSGEQFSFLIMMGSASYDIFLIQMLYYYFIAGHIYLLLPIRLLSYSLNIILCILFGLLFYKFETPVTQSIIDRAKSLLG